jgi:hypothetical protein
VAKWNVLIAAYVGIMGKCVRHRRLIYINNMYGMAVSKRYKLARMLSKGCPGGPANGMRRFRFIIFHIHMIYISTLCNEPINDHL